MTSDGNMGKPEDAITVFDDLIKRYGEDAEPSVREQVASALFAKAYTISIFLKDVKSTLDILDQFDEHIKKIDFKSKVLAEFAALAYSLRSSVLPKADSSDNLKAKTKAKESTKGDLSSNLKVILESIFRFLSDDKRKEYFRRIDEAKARTDRFLKDKSLFAKNSSFLLILRQWNSYTPKIPAIEEADRGGGYFFRHGEEGVVIDPGYDFIDNFYRAGGRMCDIDHIIITHKERGQVCR